MRRATSRGTLLVLLSIAAVLLAGCATPPEETRGGNPDVGPDAVYEEREFNAFVTPDEPFRTAVAVQRESGNVEADFTLTDQRAADAERDWQTGVPEEFEPVNVVISYLTVDSEGLQDGTTDTNDLVVIKQVNATVVPEDAEQVTFGIDLSEREDFWEDYPDEAAIAVWLDIEVDDGPVRVIGHLRSFK